MWLSYKCPHSFYNKNSKWVSYISHPVKSHVSFSNLFLKECIHFIEDATTHCIYNMFTIYQLCGLLLLLILLFSILFNFFLKKSNHMKCVKSGISINYGGLKSLIVELNLDGRNIRC